MTLSNWHPPFIDVLQAPGRPYKYLGEQREVKCVGDGASAGHPHKCEGT